eukprot:1160009-Pelagomonas_calceolata.AAC.6
MIVTKHRFAATLLASRCVELISSAAYHGVDEAWISKHPVLALARGPKAGEGHERGTQRLRCAWHGAAMKHQVEDLIDGVHVISKMNCFAAF